MLVITSQDCVQNILPGKANDLEPADDAVEDDGTPVLDEEDLEENGIDDEEAENIIWDEPASAPK